MVYCLQFKIYMFMVYSLRIIEVQVYSVMLTVLLFKIYRFIATSLRFMDYGVRGLQCTVNGL